MGKEYVKRANEGLPRQEYFFIQALDSGWGVNMAMCIARSKGWDIYNETLTRSVADNEPLKHAIKLFHKWTYVDHIGSDRGGRRFDEYRRRLRRRRLLEFHLRQVRDDTWAATA